MNLYEDLSRLLDGDLPDDQARALRRRIDAEPEVAEAWEAVQAAVVALEALPVEVPLPGHLTQPVSVPEPSRSGWMVAGVALVAMAAAMLFAFRAPPPTVIAMGQGASEVEGAVQVLVGDVVVDLDGRARIDVEPFAPPVRGGGQEVEMNRNAILAGLAGAAVTVTVYEGRAAVRAPDATDAVEVKAGSTHTVPTRGPVGGATDAPGVDDAAREAELRARVEQLTDELGAIEDELATERFAGRLREAELERIQGVASEWHDAVPSALRPDAFEADVLPMAEAAPGFSVDEVDCSEYPCIAVLRYDGDDETLDWGSELGEQLGAWGDKNLDDASLSINKSVFQHDDVRSRYMIFGMQDGNDASVEQRTGARMDDLIDMLGEENREAAAGDEDVDVTQ